MAKSLEEKIRFAVDELCGKGNLGIIDEMFSIDYIAHAGDKEYSGHAFIRRFTKQLRTAITKLRIEDIQFLARDGNTIAWQRTFSGVNTLAMRGIPASGEKVKWVEMVVTRFKNGKVAEDWLVSELMGELLLKVPRKK